MKFINFISLRFISYILLGIAIIIEFIYLYNDIFAWMKKAWFGYPPDKFGFFVPIIFLFLMIIRVVRKSKIGINSDFKGIIIILLGVGIYLSGFAADIHIIQAISLLIIGFGAVFFMMGKEWGRISMFPFAFLIFMMPTCSFLIESSLGVHLRDLTAILSGISLDILGGNWVTNNGILYINEIDLPIQYFRDSISSPLVLLILTSVVAELLFQKNRSKFIFVVLLWIPLFIVAHSIFTTAMGTTYEHNYYRLSKVIWESRRWLPALIFTVNLIPIGLTIKKLGGDRSEVKV